MERKLASIQRVLGIEPIAGADAIELARIGGWQCVTKKGEFGVGDLGIFLEIDAVPPDNETFRFLWARKPKEGEATELATEAASEPASEPAPRPGNYRLRTMKLRGALSQGLLLPLRGFELGPVGEGDDVTAALGVEKYEPPIPTGMGDYRAPFPGFIPKTDEMRVQSVPGVLGELRGLPYVATLKYDGSSATFCIDPRDGEFHACSRNQSVLQGENSYWRVAKALGIEEILRRAPHLAVQGEVCGPGIQKNRLGLKTVSLFVFNVYNLESASYLDHEAAQRWLRNHGLTPVEVVEVGEAFGHDQESLLALAEGKYAGTSHEREGIVIRPLRETRSAVLAGRLSFKAISNRFLLKEGD